MKNLFNIFRKTFTDAPLWVDYVYRVTAWFDYTVCRLVSRMTDWRYTFLDRHCRCYKCEERRARGIQK